MAPSWWPNWWAEAIESAEGSQLDVGDLERGLAELEAQYGITLPDDLETLMGDDVVLAVDGEGLLTGVPGIGVRSVTDPAAGDDLASRIETTLASLTGGFGITARGTDDGMVVASLGGLRDAALQSPVTGALGRTRPSRTHCRTPPTPRTWCGSTSRRSAASWRWRPPRPVE